MALNTIYIKGDDSNFINQSKSVCMKYGYFWPDSLTYRSNQYIKLNLNGKSVSVVDSINETKSTTQSKTIAHLIAAISPISVSAIYDPYEGVLVLI